MPQSLHQGCMNRGNREHSPFCRLYFPGGKKRAFLFDAHTAAALATPGSFGCVVLFANSAAMAKDRAPASAQNVGRLISIKAKFESQNHRERPTKIGNRLGVVS